jgi:signal transduction histidine kinase
MPNQPTDLKLFHRGLILISAPLAFELIFVGVLYYFYIQANEEALQQSRSKAFVAQTNKLSIIILQSSYALLSFKALRSRAFLHEYDKIVNEVPDAETLLTNLSQDNPARQKHVSRLKEIVERILLLTKRFRDPTESVSYLLVNPLTFRLEMERNYRSFLEEVNRVDVEESELQNLDNDAERAFKNRFRNLLWLGVLSNIGITIWLAFVFSKNIALRLDILGDNAKRLALREPLNDVLPGNDEIAKLDQTFHSVAVDLRMAEQRKQDFVSMISHDLRTPLTTIQTTLGLLQSSPDKNSEIDTNRIISASRNVKRMKRMLDQLLDMEKLEAGMLKIAPALTDLDSIIKQSMDSIDELAQEKNISINYSSKRQIVFADEERLGQVLTNLLSNAVKFAPSKSTVNLSVAEKDETVKVLVHDQGPGISPDDQAKIFDRFHQVTNELSANKVGTGLGLAIAKGLVEAHGGEIGIDSAVGKGSTFWFSIPTS